MSLNDTPSGERVHIGLFGRRNAGKSSLINALTGQDVAIVSNVAGTTTDPVSKAMELLPLGPVVFVDTPGLDDDTTLGAARVRQTLRALEKVDIALLVVDAGQGKGAIGDDLMEDLIAKFSVRRIPHLTVYNKNDLAVASPVLTGEDEIAVSALTGEGIAELKERIARLEPTALSPKQIVGDLLSPGDLVVLVVPIDSAAPKGRLILPQQQTIRDILDAGAQVVVSKEDALAGLFPKLAQRPALVITDSQVFQQVAAATPDDILLTSFSILFARYKGILAPAVAGLTALDCLEDGDKVLISEGCSHHRQCDDIGTVKIPGWIREATGRDITFEFSSGGGFPDDLPPYALIVHCGGCMLKDRVVQHRLATAQEQGVPMTNYGMLIARTKGILPRSLAPLGI